MSWTSQYFVDIIKYIYDYVDNEKSVLTVKRDFFGSGKEAGKRFVKLGDFVAMLTAQAYFSNVFTDEVKAVVEDIEALLRDYDLSTTSLDLMDKVIANNLSKKE